MYCGIGKKQISLIDNETNREIVINNHREFCLKHFPKEFVDKLIEELKKLDLYDLLLVSDSDYDVLVWNTYFEKIKKLVCAKCPQAEKFFEIGSQATLESDTYFNEYSIMIGFIPDDVNDFINNYVNYEVVVNNIVDYINAVIPAKYVWYAISNDYNFEDKSKKSFDTMEECYNDMRNSAFEKMKWNTQFAEDFCDCTSIGYRVSFAKDKIVHCSYSGNYVYQIFVDGETPNYEEMLKGWEECIM